MALALERGGYALAITGALLFLAGLLQGLVVDQFANPRMALSAHLDAVQSGMAVMIAGVLWSAARLNRVTERIARWALALGMVGLWLGITIAAMTGASEALPMAGEGYSGGALAETMVSAIIIASSAAILVGWGLFAFGLIRGSSRGG